jgi:hypothetical protein
MSKVNVVQKPGEEEVAAQVIAQSIVKISNATSALLRSGLNFKAIKLLISHSSGVNQRDVHEVLYAMENLSRQYLVQPKSKS